MVTSYFCGQTLDDVMRSVIVEIFANGEYINPTKGRCAELTGVSLEITNPRARLSRTETRGKPFSCLGELCWYLANTNELEFISYYIPDYRKYADGNIIFGGYGPRLFNWKGQNQIANVTDRLRSSPDSRRAVIQLFDAGDIVEEHNDTPCTCTLQFIVRHDVLHMFTHMRSNDVILGFPHDVFCFTMLQEIIARDLSVDVGVYKHVVGSLHLYDRDRDVAQQFLDEGWQSTEVPMPTMPLGNPWPAIQTLLDAEVTIRNGNLLDAAKLENLDVYWIDLIRLLQVFQYSKYNDIDNIGELSRRMSSPTYRTYIEKKLNECQNLSKRQDLLS